MTVPKNKLLEPLMEVADILTPAMLIEMVENKEFIIATTNRIFLRDFKLCDGDIEIQFYVDAIFENCFTPEIIELWERDSIVPFPDEWR
ncbi:MAG: hypothetical protein HN729_02025 [Candidatus Marinimicrobia bacterium]|jgi:hypothetical protein|nr:hypothetical protein [Candidatus Neomarinimicrobiota bacterium]MBT3683983.1 hypothetical protein [Candidatus Neomarinimicrobiota bacterium]MBT3760924.1 hypothetical protein [Candidatus Neomarinimicrobiota bacterium]MBT4173991.1 hypothetical protein [Candidatus Neomarinimicrobiota bacterium]MBT4538618.1 hypothetical protein [Candidatus Neomarinimicrobiota bacterium]